MSVLDILKKHLDNVFSSIDKKNDDDKNLIDNQLSKNNALNHLNKNKIKYNSFFEQEIKNHHINKDSFYEIKKQSLTNPNINEQKSLNAIIKKDLKFKIFKIICQSNFNNIILISEAIELEKKFIKKTKINITTKHLVQVGLIKEEKEIPKDFNDVDDEYLDEQEKHLSRFANPMAKHIQNNIQEQISSKRKDSNEDSNKKYHSQINEKRKIYSEEESSVYKSAIENFLKENNSFFDDKKQQISKTKNNEDFDEDFFNDLIDFNDDDEDK